MENVVIQHLQKLNVPISKKFTKKLLASHPDYPSILSVADTLQQLGISNAITRVNKTQLDDISFPVLLHLEKGGGELVSVDQKSEIELQSKKFEYWSGVLIKIEPTTKIPNSENEKFLKEEKRFRLLVFGMMSIFMGLLTLTTLLSFSWLQLFFITSAMIGGVIGYFLFAKDLGVVYRTVESFCNAGTGAGCGKVLDSEEGKVLGFITFSDLTLSYFVAQIVVAGLLVPLWTGNSIISVLGWLSFLAIPMVGYSIWLQAAKIKEWCRLCLLVSGLLLVQALFFGYAFYNGLLQPFSAGPADSIIVLLLFGIVTTSILSLKQVIKEKSRAVQEEVASNRIKNSIEVFKNLLFNQRKVDTTPLENDFLIGDPNAPVKLTMAVNQYCGPCKMELEKAWELISIFPGMVNLSLRFLKSADDGRTSNLLLKNWLLRKVKGESNARADGQQLIQAWYDIMDVDKFADSHPINGKLPSAEVNAYLRAHYDWIENAEISKTPTTFMNGFELPQQYRIKDLFALIPGLADNFVSSHLNEKAKARGDNA